MSRTGEIHLSAITLVMRLRPQGRAAALFAAVSGLFIFRVGLIFVGFGWVAYSSLPTNAYAMLVGCGLAVLPRPTLPARAAIATGALVIAASMLAAWTVLPQPVFLAPAGVVLGAALMLLGAVQGNRLLEMAPLRFIGRISYALYLWHWPMLYLADEVNSGLSSLPVVGASFIVATFSTIFVEEPIRTWWRQRRVAQTPAHTIAGASR